MNEVVNLALYPGYTLDKIFNLALTVVNKYNSHKGGQIELQEFIEVVTKFFSPPKGSIQLNSTYQRAANTLFFSLYFHPIYKWDQVIGVRNLYVIEAERIAQSRSKQALVKLAEESDLSSYKNLPSVKLEYSGFLMDRTLEEEMDDIFRSYISVKLQNVQ